MFTFGIAFYFIVEVIVDISTLMCGMNIASPSQQLTNHPWNGRGHVKWLILNF